MTPETTPPFGEYVVKLLLAGPGVCYVPPGDENTRKELLAAYGRFGENVAATWRTHHVWLRQTATERAIQPRFSGLFFAEALAKEGTR